MTNHVSTTETTKPVVLSSAEIDKLLSMTLIANLGTTEDDGSIHLPHMWFIRIGNEICIPISHHTHKYRNLRARPRASVTIDV
jgi:nitroimidazol reductase NimA-like FMN-containing flavoprotein (pyridoxamine 5'-phosphate oxidase superfamily)